MAAIADWLSLYMLAMVSWIFSQMSLSIANVMAQISDKKLYIFDRYSLTQLWFEPSI
jgi:hypothetical protein